MSTESLSTTTPVTAFAGPTAVCRDNTCPLAGEPQPVGAFDENPQAKTGRNGVCRRCVDRKRAVARARARDIAVDLTLPVISERRERARALLDEGLYRAEAEDALDRDDARDEALALAYGALAELAAARPDGRADLAPVRGPRSQRERAAEARAALLALVPDLEAPVRVRPRRRA